MVVLLEERSTRTSYRALAVGKLITLEPLVAELNTMFAVVAVRVSKSQIEIVPLEVVITERVRGPVVGGWMNPV